MPTVRKDRATEVSATKPESAIAKRSQDGLMTQPEQGLSPRQRLRAVAKGDAPLCHQDIEALLTDLVLAADQRSRNLSRRCTELLEMVFDAKSRKSMDPAAAMDLVMKLDRVQRNHQADARRGIELLSKISRPRRPMVQVTASQLNVAEAQQVTGPVDLGE